MSETAKGNGKNSVIEVSKLGKPFKRDTHVAFIFHRHHFQGVVEKQLKNSAIIDFDSEFSQSNTAQELKQKVVISYTKLKLIN
ncbi:MAG: hypothetical protein ABF624_04950 [Liquorilactobacillus ghanensis]|jgi:uncharacterized protein YkvS|uniref:DUF2187 domain-containing protein n=1 Tax=Liquorilactobacillus ghanensis DSM 18630 TaxID=1423750 RepID=A0A0R1VKV1_9LACO|nr:hypothetical protein [Liquorilactobacillus ghanensis]KRM06250.1 hypothetical protein FC89_GL001122 [Liquorilactobacillus ghanensis DSM 18630]